MISAILLAAGQSKRFKNENKLTKVYKNKPLINHILSSLIRSEINKIIGAKIKIRLNLLSDPA